MVDVTEDGWMAYMMFSHIFLDHKLVMKVINIVVKTERKINLGMASLHREKPYIFFLSECMLHGILFLKSYIYSLRILYTGFEIQNHGLLYQFLFSSSKTWFWLRKHLLAIK